MASAQRLLEQKSYKEVSVLSVVSDSGVNRNTFYYHFKDMPSLVRELALRSADRILEESESAARALSLTVNTLYDNRKTLMHIFSSADREIFDRELEVVCVDFVRSLDRRYGLSEGMTSETAGYRLSVFKCALYGLLSQALQLGMREDERQNSCVLVGECLKLLK